MDCREPAHVGAHTAREQAMRPRDDAGRFTRDRDISREHARLIGQLTSRDKHRRLHEAIAPPPHRPERSSAPLQRMPGMRIWPHEWQ
jgi:hypothetical protein